jgi:tetratricopeptide (TPR) repeat protein
MNADKPSANESSAGTREPKDYAGWVGRGEQMLAKHDLAGAQQAFQTAVSLRGTGSEANSGLGAALLGQGQTREAIPYLTRAASNGFAEASVSLGDAYRKLGDKDNAIEAYETYLARLPRGARASYVKLQLEGLGKEVGGAKPEAPAARETEQRAAPSTEYRPAGEMNEPAPAPAPAAENPQ